MTTSSVEGPPDLAQERGAPMTSTTSGTTQRRQAALGARQLGIIRTLAGQPPHFHERPYLEADGPGAPGARPCACSTR